MLVMSTTEYSAHPVRKLVCSEQPLRLDDLALGVNPLWLDGVEPRTLLRKQATEDPHALAASLMRRLCLPSHLLTSLEICQLALSQMRSRTFLPIASSFSKLHSTNRVVIELTGLPSTKRTHVSSIPGR